MTTKEPREASESPSVLVEGGIAKVPAGRLPEEARAEAAAVWGRTPTCEVFRFDESWSLDRINALDPGPGATFLFRRGCVWRGQLRVRSGTPEHPVRYGSWGDGREPAPVIQPSHGRDDPDLWRLEPDGLWSVAAGGSADIGNVVLDHGDDGCLFRRRSRAEALSDRDFWFDPASRRVFVRSGRGNPARRWRSVELAEMRHCVDQGAAHDVVYEGLAVRCGAAHGFGGGGAARIGISGCDVSWIGGGYLYVDDLGNGVRYGNGIEFWGGAEDVCVEHCTVRQCWDAGLTNQTNEPGSVQRNVRWRGNTVRDCEYSFEFWHQGEDGVAENIVLSGNSFHDAGSGWGHSQRWNPNAAHLMLYDTCVPASGIDISGNTFSRSADVLARVFNDWSGIEPGIRDNVWESAGEPVCRFHGRPRASLRHLYPDRLDRIHSDDAAEIEAQGSGACIFEADDDGFRRFATRFGSGTFRRIP